MILLILIGFLGGLVTGISPCILPVLPVIFAAGAASGLDDVDAEAGTAPPVSGAAGPPVEAESVGVELKSAALVGARGGAGAGNARQDLGPSGGSSADGTDEVTVPDDPLRDRRAELRRRRRPIAVVGGLVLSFSVFTLVGSWLLERPGSAPGSAAVDRPGRSRPGRSGSHRARSWGSGWSGPSPDWPAAGSGPTAAGSSSGSAWAWCSCRAPARCSPPSPWSAPITAYGFSSVVLTVAFAVGVAVPLLVFAVLGQRLAERMRSIRARAVVARRVIGAVLVVTALVIGLNLTDGLQRAVPGYTNALQSHIESNTSATQALARVSGNVVTGALASTAPRRARSCTVREGPGLRRDQPLAQHARGPAPDAGRTEGPRGAGRLLDLLLHQLPAHRCPMSRPGTAPTPRTD